MGDLRGEHIDDYSDYGLTLETVDGTSLYTSKALHAECGILVVFTTREGGYSRTPYDSLNLALHVCDDDATVIKNRKALCALVGLDSSRMTCAEQVHGNKVAVIDESIAGSGAVLLKEAVRGVDALVTNIETVPLALFFADCVPVVIVEPRHRIIAVAHAGWRGVHGNIVEKTIGIMVEEWVVEPADMIAFIGPSIGGCCYAVGEDMINKFEEIFSDKDRWLHGGKLDLPALVYHQIEKAGIERARIFSCADSCTSCRTDLFFSYRGDRGVTGRQSAIAAVLPHQDSSCASDLP